MITEVFIWVLGGAVLLMAFLMPSLPSPDVVLDGVGDGISSVFAAAGALSFWVPFSAAGAALALVALVAVAACVIKLVPIVLSFLTLRGGSAA